MAVEFQYRVLSLLYLICEVLICYWCFFSAVRFCGRLLGLLGQSGDNQYDGSHHSSLPHLSHSSGKLLPLLLLAVLNVIKNIQYYDNICHWKLVWEKIENAYRLSQDVFFCIKVRQICKTGRAPTSLMLTPVVCLRILEQFFTSVASKLFELLSSKLSVSALWAEICISLLFISRSPDRLQHNCPFFKISKIIRITRLNEVIFHSTVASTDINGHKMNEIELLFYC